MKGLSTNLRSKLCILLLLGILGVFGGSTLQSITAPAFVEAKELPEGVCVLDEGCLCSYSCDWHNTLTCAVAGDRCVQQ